MYYQQFMFYLKFQLNWLFHPGLNLNPWFSMFLPHQSNWQPLDVSANSGTPKSSIFIWCSIINPSILGYIYPYFLKRPIYFLHQATTVAQVPEVLALFEIVWKATRRSRTLQGFPGFPSACGTTPWREQPSHGSMDLTSRRVR